MRILHTCLRYPPATGGVETYVRDIVEHTRNIDEHRDVRVLTSRMRTHGPITELNPDTLLDDPPYVQRLHHSKTPFISYPRLQALPYYIHHHNPDIIHGYSFWYQPADVAARYARAHQKPFIFHPIYYENDIRKKPLWQLYKRTYGRDTFRAADVVAVISPYEQKLIEDANFPVRRFELIPPGIDTSIFERSFPNPFPERGITGPVLLTVSRLAAGKGLADIIKAFPEIQKHTPGVSLVIIGEDFGEQKNLEALAAGNKTIQFWGKVSDEIIRGAYQHAAVLVHPSHYEAFGIVLAEAQAAGTPVVARNTSAIPFVASPEHGGLLFNTTEKLIKNITQLLENESLRVGKGAAGKEYVTKTFNQEAITKKLLTLYEQLSN